jgi:hypothetical protein
MAMLGRIFNQGQNNQNNVQSKQYKSFDRTSVSVHEGGHAAVQHLEEWVSDRV